MIKLFFLLGFFFSASSVLALTDVEFSDPLLFVSYELSVTYDSATQTLLPPISTTRAYTIVRKDFAPPVSAFNGEFLGILLGPKEKEYQRFGIQKPEKSVTGGKEIFTTPAPYHPSAERIDIYKGAVKLFSIDVTGSRICVEDGMCMSEVGENDQNCSADCALVLPPPPTQTPTQAETPSEPRPITPGALPPIAQSGEDSIEEAGTLVSSRFLPLVFFGLGLLSFVVWVYLRKKARG